MGNLLYNDIHKFLLEIQEKYNISENKIDFFKAYYGISQSKSLSLQKIGDDNGISKERARQSIDDVRSFCKAYIKEDGDWFINKLNALNTIIIKHLPAEKNRLIKELAEVEDCGRWVVAQKDIFDIDPPFILSKYNKKTFVYQKGFQSQRLTPFKVGMAKSKGYSVESSRIININDIKKSQLEKLYQENYVGDIALANFISSIMKKEIIKNGTLFIDSFDKVMQEEMQKHVKLPNMTRKKRLLLIDDVIFSDSDFIKIDEKWIWNNSLSRNVMLRNTYKILSVYKKINISLLRKIILLKTNVEYLPPVKVIKKILEKDNLVTVNQNTLENRSLFYKDFLTENEIKILNRIKASKTKTIEISSYDSLWGVANNSTLFLKKQNSQFSLFN